MVSSKQAMIFTKWTQCKIDSLKNVIHHNVQPNATAVRSTCRLHDAAFSCFEPKDSIAVAEGQSSAKAVGCTPFISVGFAAYRLERYGCVTAGQPRLPRCHGSADALGTATDESRSSNASCRSSLHTTSASPVKVPTLLGIF